MRCICNCVRKNRVCPRKIIFRHMKDQNSTQETVCSLREQKEWPSPLEDKDCSCSWLFLMLWHLQLMLITKAESSSSGYLSSGSSTTSLTENSLSAHIAALFMLKPLYHIQGALSGTRALLASTWPQSWAASPNPSVYNEQESDHGYARRGELF